MRVCRVQEMKEAEAALFARGICALDLMEDVGRKMARGLMDRYPTPGVCVAYVGKGNNGGDALVVLRHLRSFGWRIGVRWAYERSLRSELLEKEEGFLQEQGDYATLSDKEEVLLFLGAGLRWPEPRIFLDGLVGLGVRGALREPCLPLALEMNELRVEEGVRTWSIDIPSGLDAESGLPHDGCVEADYTACIGGVKQGLLAEKATCFVGRLLPIALRGLVLAPSSIEVAEGDRLRAWLPPRPYDWYKNKAGKVLILAGSLGMVGAACLCAEGAIKGGAGMVILGVDESIYSLVAGRVLPEIMVLPWARALELVSWADVLVAGPGLGNLSGEKEKQLWKFVHRFKGKVVLDADALNSWANGLHKEYLDHRFLLTPHEGEMQRMLARHEEESREDWGARFMSRYSCSLLLKGVKTLIFHREEPLYMTTSGGPAMATAGQGDVLSGLCGALMAQGMSPFRAGVMGSYLVGVAMEKALAQGESIPSFSASSSLATLAGAFKSLRS